MDRAVGCDRRREHRLGLEIGRMSYGSTRYTSGLRYGAQWLVMLKVRLEQTKPIKRKLPDGFWESGKLVHTRRVR